MKQLGNMTVTPSVGTQGGEKPQVSRVNVDNPLAVVAMMGQTVLREEGVLHEVRRTSFGDTKQVCTENEIVEICFPCGPVD